MDGNGETTIFCVKIWNHPIETTKCKWMFQVLGIDCGLTLFAFTVFSCKMCVCVSFLEICRKTVKNSYCLPHEVDTFSLFFLIAP